MKWGFNMAEIRFKELKTKFVEFAKKYKSLYSKSAWEYIEEEIFNALKENDAPDILMQIYSELKINPSPARFYQHHLKLVKENFPIDGNIVDIASGMLPAFANLLAEEQLHIGKGTVTIYEPLLLSMEPKHPNITLHKEEFTSDTDLSKYDLVTGIMPCDATEIILENAIRNHKNFYVAMCGCVHDPLAYYYGYMGIAPEVYQEKVIAKAEKLLKEYDDGTLEVTQLKNTELNYPILYNKK